MISREAGLNDTASKCTGVPSYEDCIDTSMSSRNDLIVKGNQVFVGSTGSERLQYGQVWNPFERKRKGSRIPNQANMDEHRQ